MIIKINNQIINVISEDTSYGWNNITTPDTSHEIMDTYEISQTTAEVIFD
jgi:hypothetical protein